MHKVFGMVFLLFILPLVTATGFPQSKCIIEPGKGCGEIQIGTSRSQIETAFGKSSSGNYFAKGFSVKYDSANVVEEITFVLDRNPNIYQSYAPFQASLAGNLTMQTTVEQLIAKYGAPKEKRDFQALETNLTKLEYAGIRIHFAASKLFYVEIFKSSEAFALREKPNFWDGFAMNTQNPVKAATDDDDGDGVKNADDLCPTTKGSKANKGCPGDNKNEASEEKLSAEEAKKLNEKLDSLKSNITFDATPTPTPTPIQKAKVSRKTAPNAALSDCQFILDDNGCGQFFGKSEAEIAALFRKPLDNNNYPDLGLFFYVWGDRNNGVPDTVAEVTFYGTGKYVKQFYGQPGENLGWNATRDDVVNQYGKPAEEKSGIDSEKLPFHYLKYGENLRISIVNNRIKEITIRFPKHNQDVEAYRERTAKENEEFFKRNRAQWAAFYRDAEKEKAAKEKAEKAAKNPYNVSPEIQSAFDSLHDQVDSLTDHANKLVSKFNQNQYIYESLGWRYAKEKQIATIHIQAADLIRKFLADYKGKLPQPMIDHLNYDIRKILLGE